MSDATNGGPLLSVADLSVVFPTSRGPIQPARGVSFEVAAGTVLGIVGESGSGKSITLRAILGLVPSPGRVVHGVIRFGDRNLVDATPRDMQSIRGSEIAMIFQDAMASLNPVLSIGDQLSEAIRIKRRIGRRAARLAAEELLDRVGIRPPRTRMRAYPHQLSGGMAQRVMIALAISAGPRLLLADEPTTALDVSVQDQILSLLERLRVETGMAMIIVSHDIGVIARTCDEVAVMYAGRILERGSVQDILQRPRHPYTRMLLATIPSIHPDPDRPPLVTIAGQLPDLTTLSHGCPFAERCSAARPGCAELAITLDRPRPEHASACPFV